MGAAAETMVATGYEKQFFRVARPFENDLGMRGGDDLILIAMNDQEVTDGTELVAQVKLKDILEKKRGDRGLVFFDGRQYGTAVHRGGQGHQP